MPVGSTYHSLTLRLLSPDNIVRPRLRSLCTWACSARTGSKADRENGEKLRSLTPNGRGACPQDRLFAQLPQAPMGSKSEEIVAGPARAERLEVPRSPSRATPRAAQPIRPCPASPVRAPSPPPAARLRLWCRTCGARCSGRKNCSPGRPPSRGWRYDEPRIAARRRRADDQSQEVAMSRIRSRPEAAAGCLAPSA